MQPARENFSWDTLNNVVADVTTWFGQVATGVTSVVVGALLFWLALMLVLLALQKRVDRLDDKLRDIQHILKEQQELMEARNEKTPAAHAGHVAQLHEPMELPNLSRLAEDERTGNAP